MQERYTKEETVEMVNQHSRWFHTIEVGHGINTPGTHDSKRKLERLQMPDDLTGWSVLDIGANDGFFSFVAEGRGATRVLAADYPHWTGDIEYYGIGNARKGQFEIARELRGSSVEDRTISVYNITREELGSFDLVLMLGVLYHLVHPTVGLERAVQLADKLVIIETGLHRDNPRTETPMMYFTPAKYDNDPTNWWYPNPQCVMDMMKTFGCEKVIPVCLEPGFQRAVFHGYKNGYSGTD